MNIVKKNNNIVENIFPNFGMHDIQYKLQSTIATTKMKIETKFWYH